MRTQADELGSRREASVVTLRALLRRALLTMRDLRTELVEASIAAQSIDRRESSLHARTVVLVLQLAELKAAEHELPTDFWSTCRTYSSITEVSRFLCAEVGRVNAAYLAERRRAHPEDASARTIAISNAENAIEAIGVDPDFACFIAAGASLRSDRFRIAARMIGTLLGIPLSAEANVWRAPRSSRGNS